MGSPEMRSGGDKIGSPEVAEVVMGGVWTGVTSVIGAVSANPKVRSGGEGSGGPGGAELPYGD
jgi:hypothetical protein